MPKKVDPEVEDRVLGLSEAGMTQRSIVTHLQRDNIVISNRTVSNIINNIGKRRVAKSRGLPSPVKVQPQKVVNPGIVEKVDLWTQKQNPPGQREMARRLKVSQTTVNRIIKNLDKQLAQKNRIHKFPAAHMQNMKSRCRKPDQTLLSGIQLLPGETTHSLEYEEQSNLETDMGHESLDIRNIQNPSPESEPAMDGVDTCTQDIGWKDELRDPLSLASNNKSGTSQYAAAIIKSEPNENEAEFEVSQTQTTFVKCEPIVGSYMMEFPGAMKSEAEQSGNFWACDTCNQDFPNYATLGEHVANGMCSEQTINQQPKPVNKDKAKEEEEELESPPIEFFPRKSIPKQAGSRTHFVCVYCRTKDRKSLMSAHMLKHKEDIEAGKAHICMYCFLKFETCKGRNAHEDLHTRPVAPFPCCKCPESFESKSLLQNHLRKEICEVGREHYVISTESKNVWICRYCHAGIPDTELQEHITDHEFCPPDLACTNCENIKKSASINGKRRHMIPLKSKKKLPCKDCQEKFRNVLCLNSHRKKDHQKCLFVCRVCRQRFHSDADLLKHREIERAQVELFYLPKEESEAHDQSQCSKKARKGSGELQGTPVLVKMEVSPVQDTEIQTEISEFHLMESIEVKCEPDLTELNQSD